MSREIDILVDEHVMNNKPLSERQKAGGIRINYKHYSSDIFAALEIIEKEKDNYERIEASWYNGKVNVIFWLTDIEPVCSAEADTAPMAICLCALKAKGVEVGK